VKTLLVTGGCGFIGSAFLRRFVPRHPELRFINLDLLTYAADPENVAEVADAPNYQFVHGDVRDRGAVRALVSESHVDAIVHFAAESHVDRSIEDATAFVSTNIGGTHALLDAARAKVGTRFVLVSTDEVYGSLSEDAPATTEDAHLHPGSPYAAAKAGADLLAQSYVRTYGLDLSITRCANNFGPCQFPEKLIPVLVRRALAGEQLPMYGNGRNIRDWLHVDDHADAVWAVLHRGVAGRVYNVGADNPRRNLEIAELVLAHLGLGPDRIAFVTDRPGHDWRYCVDDTRLRTELGWAPQVPFEAGLRATIDWYAQHPLWIERALARGAATWGPR
jgi:dTDP-glucose 4,6-dehydratase